MTTQITDEEYVLVYERIIVLVEELRKLHKKIDKSQKDFGEIDEITAKLLKVKKDHPENWEVLFENAYSDFKKEWPSLFAPEDESQEAPNIGQRESIISRKDFLLCEPGTKWHEIKITAVSNRALKIKTPKGEERFNYNEIGFSDNRRKEEPTKLWNLLLVFCQEMGTVSLSNASEQKENIYKMVSDLNKKLQSLFGISESFLDKGRYQRRKGYVASILFSDQRDAETLQTRTPDDPDDDLVEHIEEEVNKLGVRGNDLS